MVPDVAKLGATCTVCAQNKTPRQALAGLLQPLLVPHHSWSHISLDFIMGLPPSEGNTPDSGRPVFQGRPLHSSPKLPSAKETTQLMVQHIFRIHGLPVDMVSDRGPQFWKAFCIGSSASLSSEFHPQSSNGQSERANQDLETSMRCLVSANPTIWSQQLVWVEHTLPCSSKALSPFYGVSGRSSPGREKRSAYLLPRCLSAAVVVSGGEPGRPSSRPPLGIKDKRIAIGPRLPSIISGRKYGYPPGICPSRCNPANSSPGLSARFPSLKLLAPLLLFFCCPVPFVYTPSMKGHISHSPLSPVTDPCLPLTCILPAPFGLITFC
jgi:hypothetical protein